MTEVANKKISELLFHSRLDADFYKPSYEKVYDKIYAIRKKYTLEKLPNLLIAPVRTGSTPSEEKRVPLEDGSDVMFIKTDSVRKGFINYETTDLLPLTEHQKRKLTAVHKEDIIVTVVGATHEIIARAGLFLRQEPANINQSDALLKVDKEKIEPGYLCAFINSKYGRTQLWKYSGQTGQVTMNCREVEELLIPIFQKDLRIRIQSLMYESEKLRESAKTKYIEANEALRSELNIDFEKIKYSPFFNDTLQEVKDKKRLDPDFFLPQYNEILESVKKRINLVPLNSLLSEKMKKGFEVGAEEYQDEGTPFIRVANITKLEINDSNMKCINENLFKQLTKKHSPQIGEILLTKDGSPGIAFPVVNKINGIVSGGIVRLIIKENIDPFYLTVALNSELTQLQMQRDSGGSILTHWRPEHIENTLIPLIFKDKMAEISSLMKNSLELFEKSKLLIKEAIMLIENEIE